jgi:hypothetical protein
MVCSSTMLFGVTRVPRWSERPSKVRARRIQTQLHSHLISMSLVVVLPATGMFFCFMARSEQRFGDSHFIGSQMSEPSVRVAVTVDHTVGRGSHLGQRMLTVYTPGCGAVVDRPWLLAPFVRVAETFTFLGS